MQFIVPVPPAVGEENSTQPFNGPDEPLHDCDERLEIWNNSENR